MSIYVRLNESETIDIDLMDINIVQDIIDYIKEIYGYHTNIAYSGLPLDPDAVIADTGISSESTLEATKRTMVGLWYCEHYYYDIIVKDGQTIALGMYGGESNRYGSDLLRILDDSQIEYSSQNDEITVKKDTYHPGVYKRRERINKAILSIMTDMTFEEDIQTITKNFNYRFDMGSTCMRHYST